MSAHSTSVQSQGGAFLQSPGGARAMTAARVYFDDTPYEFHVNLSNFTGWSQTQPAYFGESTSETSIPDLDIYELGTSTLWNTVDEVSTVDYSLVVGSGKNASKHIGPGDPAPTTCPTTSELPEGLCESWWKTTYAGSPDVSYDYIGLVVRDHYPFPWQEVGEGIDDTGPFSYSAGAIIEDLIPYPVYVVSGDLYVRIANIVYPLVIILDVDVSNISSWADDKFSSITLGFTWDAVDEVWENYSYWNRDDYFANWTFQATEYNGGGYGLVRTEAIYSCYQQLNDEITLYEA